MVKKYLCQAAKELAQQSAKFKKTNTLESIAAGNDYFLQPKYDGCHGIVMTGSPATHAPCMASRTGERVLSVEHITRECLATFGFGWVVFGEVYRFDTPFKDISGMYRRHNHEPTLVFVVYDIISLDQFHAGHSPTPYATRYGHLNAALDSNPSALSLAKCPNLEANGVLLLEFANKLVQAGGYDGGMLRRKDSQWFQDNSKEGELIKLKPIQSLDLLCVGVEKKVGEKTGRATCALIVEYEGVQSKVSTGLSAAEQADPDQFVGKIIEVEFMERTEAGAFREPRVKGVRPDKVKPD